METLPVPLSITSGSGAMALSAPCAGASPHCLWRCGWLWVWVETHGPRKHLRGGAGGQAALGGAAGSPRPGAALLAPPRVTARLSLLWAPEPGCTGSNPTCTTPEVCVLCHSFSLPVPQFLHCPCETGITMMAPTSGN